MKQIPEPSEQELISSLGYDGCLVWYSLDEDDGILDRIDRDIRRRLEIINNKPTRRTYE